MTNHGLCRTNKFSENTMTFAKKEKTYESEHVKKKNY